MTPLSTQRVRGCLQYLGVTEGVEIHHVADLPARTGLGTSSAFIPWGCSWSLYALKERMRDKHALAQDAIHVEREVLQGAVGAQDQVAAAYGGFNRINFHTDGSIDVKPLLAPSSRLAELQSHFPSLLHRIRAHSLRDRKGAGEGNA